MMIMNDDDWVIESIECFDAIGMAGISNYTPRESGEYKYSFMPWILQLQPGIINSLAIAQAERWVSWN